MPRYLFSNEDYVRDEDTRGTEVAGVAPARPQAIKVAGAAPSDEPDLVWDGSEFKVEVTDGPARRSM